MLLWPHSQNSTLISTQLISNRHPQQPSDLTHYFLSSGEPSVDMALFEFKPMPFPVNVDHVACCFDEVWNANSTAEEATLSKLAQSVDEYVLVCYACDG